MIGQPELMVGGIPELMEAYATTAGGVADVLTRQAIALREALGRLQATSDPSLTGRFGELDRSLGSIAEEVRATGEMAGRAAAALKTADTTAHRDIVLMAHSRFTAIFGTAPPPSSGGAPSAPAPAPTGPVPGLPPGSPTTIDGWRQLAYERAGVDTDGWDTGADMKVNDQRIQAIWERYGQLYLADPQRFWWAGMAKFAGATVYAGMMDLASIVELTDADDRAQALREWVQGAVPGAGEETVAWLLGRVVDLSGDQLRGFLTRFQEMEKAIADDLLWQHEVYREGGLPAVLALIEQASGHNEERRDRLIEAWRAIDTGEPASVKEGSLLLVDVEQRLVLDPYYQELRSSPAGRAFAEVLTLAAESPVPGGRAYRDARRDDRVIHRLGWPDLDVPLHRWPARGSLRRVEGDITDKDDRWQWVKDDLYPAYARFLAEHPDDMERMMKTPLADLAEPRRRSPVSYER